MGALGSCQQFLQFGSIQISSSEDLSVDVILRHLESLLAAVVAAGVLLGLRTVIVLLPTCRNANVDRSSWRGYLPYTAHCVSPRIGSGSPAPSRDSGVGAFGHSGEFLWLLAPTHGAVGSDCTDPDRHSVSPPASPSSRRVSPVARGKSCGSSTYGRGDPLRGGRSSPGHTRPLRQLHLCQSRLVAP